MIEALLVAGLIYVVYESGALAPLGFVPAPSGPGLATPQQAATNQALVIRAQTQGIPVVQPPPSNTGALAAQGAAAVGTGAVTGATTLANVSVAGISGAALGAATAGIGVVATVFAVLWSRHKQREAQAKGENSAVNLGVNGFDSDIQYINQAYNAGQIDSTTAIRALQQAYAQYWLLTGPKVQPGRNGCQNGNACGAMQTKLLGGTQPCVGDIGAACCVGCAPLYYSLYATGNEKGVNPAGPGAITVLQSGGGRSVIKTVYGSSYGATTRQSYTLDWGQVHQ